MIAVERLHESAARRIIALAVDRVVDRIARLPPARQRGLSPAFLGQSYAVVQRGPAHRLGMHIVARSAAELPDAVVGLLPIVAGGIDHGDQKVPVRVINSVAAGVPFPRHLEYLAIDVELILFGS